ncbi:MAG: methylmalonyl Co-A mutase-associated GTPase MeaB [Gemmatimonadota bacterium]|nr:methylmalonyl Co-A mutase-associated GTPase MeaB [Gemmatimonadota bacterium]MDE2983402.1 methylmalonyl Co-A mutase-associated GTPase MeaB [Gemmatimonadota bacterium]
MSALHRDSAERAGGRTSGAAAGRKRLVDDFHAGKRPALARAISMVEGRRSGVGALLQELLLAEPQACRLGVTGPPGAGKSSLIAGLATLLRGRGEEVAIVAVDPTSPFSGGALLGDRIRMNDLATDPGIFIRSMATRGSLGGLAAATREVIDLLDAFGFPNILIETVGVGQTELEIASTADSVAVVLVPESGDGIQAMKAGLMEIADLFVVNKSDRIGADRMVRAIGQALLLKTGHGGHDVPAHHGVDLSRVEAASASRTDAHTPSATPGWTIPVLKTSAGRGEGIDGFLKHFDAHQHYLGESGELDLRRRARAGRRIRDVVEGHLRRRAGDYLERHPDHSRWIAEVAAGRETAYGVAASVITAILREAPDSGTT